MRKRKLGCMVMVAALLVGGIPATDQSVTQTEKLAKQGNTTETVQVVSTGALTLSDAIVDERAYDENIIYMQENEKWHMKPGYYHDDSVYSNGDTVEIHVSDAYVNGEKKKRGVGIMDIDSYGVSKGTVLNNKKNARYNKSTRWESNAGMSIQTVKHIYLVNDCYINGTDTAVIWQYSKKGDFQKEIKVKMKSLLQPEDKHVRISKVCKGNSKFIEVFFVTNTHSGLARIDLEKGRITKVRPFEGVTIKVPSAVSGEAYRFQSDLLSYFRTDVDDTYFYYVYSTSTRDGSIYITIGSKETGKVLVTREILKKDLYKDPAYSLTLKDGYAYLLTRTGRYPGKTDKLYQINVLTGEMYMRKDFNIDEKYYNEFCKWKFFVVNENEFYIVYKNGYTDLTVVKYFTEDTIKLNKTLMTVNVGKSEKLYLSGTCGKTKWKSSNSRVATVNSKGKVTGKKTGRCKISVIMKNKMYTCMVTVRK